MVREPATLLPQDDPRALRACQITFVTLALEPDSDTRLCESGGLGMAQRFHESRITIEKIFTLRRSCVSFSKTRVLQSFSDTLHMLLLQVLVQIDVGENATQCFLANDRTTERASCGVDVVRPCLQCTRGRPKAENLCAKRLSGSTSSRGGFAMQ